MKLKTKKVYAAFLLFSVFICGITIYNNRIEEVFLPLNNYFIVIDAGHGGWDPGKTAQNSMDEKDINLDIAKKTGMFLQEKGADVIFTRQEDEVLGKTKKEDMINRMDIINGCGADIMISIHQNSYSDSGIRGGQVFYFENSENGRILAESVQKSLNEIAENKNTRMAKGNGSYYMLKKSDIPAVIIECGFLSNEDEREKLNSEEYRLMVAWAICDGISRYFEGEKTRVQVFNEVF